jgi:hypothetical protein
MEFTKDNNAVENRTDKKEMYHRMAIEYCVDNITDCGSLERISKVVQKIWHLENNKELNQNSQGI